MSKELPENFENTKLPEIQLAVYRLVKSQLEDFSGLNLTVIEAAKLHGIVKEILERYNFQEAERLDRRREYKDRVIKHPEQKQEIQNEYEGYRKSSGFTRMMDPSTETFDNFIKNEWGIQDTDAVLKFISDIEQEKSDIEKNKLKEKIREIIGRIVVESRGYPELKE